ncbi:TPA: hypothetical protein ACGF53_003394, partial [Vibrio cholerae]
GKLLKAKAKLPKRLCAKLTNLAHSQNSIEATAQKSRWQTMPICRGTRANGRRKKEKPQTTDF